ncbi:MAG: fructosamine kinase family protein [Wenzhouxiangella sp.]|nr:fructosamine kinase family protein [Wenzhouxiangella sp.]MCH8479506.1 fructosamine kinase family protein [Wenzhouxiangella sp.]
MSIRLDLEQASQIARQLGLNERGLRCQAIAGGDIAGSWLIDTNDQQLFVKTMPTRHGSVLSAEADGLAALAQAAAVRVPRVRGRGTETEFSWLALEYLPLNRRSREADVRLGRSLARQHRHVGERYGWARDNFIGLSRQQNTVEDDWATFFLWHRLAPQLDMLESKDPDGRWGRYQRSLFETWLKRFAHHRPEPALIHGDLWSGNAAMADEAEPVIFDPAVHYADRECDLAMSRLFGGFSEAFYQAYEATWPLPADYQQRQSWYQLYHLLNHANLFGGAYLERAAGLIQRLIRD